MKLVAVVGCTLTVTPTAPATSGSAAVQTAPSTTVRAQGAAVYRGPIVVGVTGVVAAPDYTQVPATQPVTITPTTGLGLADTQAIVRQDDQGTGVVNLVSPSGNPPLAVPVTVVVSDAGQTKVRLR